MLTPEEFQERFAAYLIDGEGDRRQMLGALLAEVRNLIPRYIQTKTERTIPDDRYATVWDCTPPLYRDHDKPRTDRVYADDPDAGIRVAKHLG